MVFLKDISEGEEDIRPEITIVNIIIIIFIMFYIYNIILYRIKGSLIPKIDTLT